MRGLTNSQLAYLVARLILGVNLFFHGLVRLPKLGSFVDGMEGAFAKTPLPGFMVTPMAYAIPIAETILGAFLILGFLTRGALIGSVILFLVLITGCCFLENWSAVTSQMVHSLYIILLLAFLDQNRFALKRAL